MSLIFAYASRRSGLRWHSRQGRISCVTQGRGVYESRTTIGEALVSILVVADLVDAE